MKQKNQKTWLNTTAAYGRLSIALHWMCAALVVGLFASGFWMVTLTYYDPLYRTIPYYHKSTGILFFALVLLRIIIRQLGKKVQPAEGLTSLEVQGSMWGHRLLYTGMIVVPLLGYGISTADGRGVEVFGMFTIPALPFSWPSSWPSQEDTLGWLHEWGAYGLIALGVGHGMMAIYHGRRVWHRMMPRRFIKIS